MRLTLAPFIAMSGSIFLLALLKRIWRINLWTCQCELCPCLQQQICGFPKIWDLPLKFEYKNSLPRGDRDTNCWHHINNNNNACPTNNRRLKMWQRDRTNSCFTSLSFPLKQFQVQLLLQTLFSSYATPTVESKGDKDYPRIVLIYLLCLTARGMMLAQLHPRNGRQSAQRSESCFIVDIEIIAHP